MCIEDGGRSSAMVTAPETLLAYVHQVVRALAKFESLTPPSILSYSGDVGRGSLFPVLLEFPEVSCSFGKCGFSCFTSRWWLRGST